MAGEYSVVLERSASFGERRPTHDQVEAVARDLGALYDGKVTSVFSRVLVGFAFVAAEDAALRLSQDARVHVVEESAALSDFASPPRIRRVPEAQPDRYMAVFAEDEGPPDAPREGPGRVSRTDGSPARERGREAGIMP